MSAAPATLRGLRIGELAKRAGTTPRTIRYYEELGLLPEAPSRDAGQHRLYGEADVERVLQLLRLKELLGLTLDELRDVIEAEEARGALRAEWHEGSPSRERRVEIVDEALGHIDGQLALLRRRREKLDELERELEEKRSTLRELRARRRLTALRPAGSVRHDARRPDTARETQRMSDDFTTDQAEREASGAHPYGRFLEEFEVGAVYKHWPAKTITETEDHLFCLLTMNHHPLHVNDVYAAASQQGRNVVVGPMVYSLALGMSVSDVSGKAIANLMTEELKHPAPVFHGDTLYCETEVLEKRESKTKLDRGTVRVHTRVLNQDGVLVAEFKRLVLVPRKEHGTPAE